MRAAQRISGCSSNSSKAKGRPTATIERLDERVLMSATLTAVQGWNGAAPYNNPSINEVPPDTMAALGPTQSMELMNGAWRVVDRSTLTVTTNTSDTQFWSQALGASSPMFQSIQTLADPRVIFDPLHGRWIATELANPETINSTLLIAVSAGSNASSGNWKALGIVTHPTVNGQVTFLDFDSLGVDQNGIYITGNEFSVSNPTFEGEAIYALNSAVFWTGSGSPANATIIYNEGQEWLNGATLQPAVSFTSNPGPEVIAAVDWNYAGLVSLQYKTITWTSSTTISLSNLQIANLNVSPSTFSPPHAAAQPANGQSLDAGDGRLNNVVVVNGYLYTTLSGTYSGNGEDAIELVKTQATNPSNIASVNLLSGGGDLLYPSIAVNNTNDVAIGCTLVNASQNIYPSTAAIGISTTGGSTLVTTFAAGTGSYHSSYGVIPGTNTARWGDYSATMVDPNDGTTFATFQEDSRDPGPDSSYTTWFQTFQVTSGGNSPATTSATALAANTTPLFSDTPIDSATTDQNGTLWDRLHSHTHHKDPIAISPN
jgi:hypothetical protein